MSSSSETRGTPDGRTAHASFTRAKYGRAIAPIEAVMARRITIASQSHQRENAANLSPRSTPVTTIAPSETYIGRIVSPDSVMRSTIFFRSRSRLIRYRTVIEVPCVPRSARTEAMCRKSSHRMYIARRIAGARSDLRRQKGS